jgi:hypothetical protein
LPQKPPIDSLRRGMLLPLELSANRALDLPMGLIRGSEDSVRVVEAERPEVDRHIMLVWTSDADVLKLRHGFDRGTAHAIQAVLGAVAVRHREDAHECAEHAGIGGRKVGGVARPAPGRLHAGGQNAVLRFRKRRIPVLDVV